MPPDKSTTLAHNVKQEVASSLPTAAAAASSPSTPSSGTTISASEFQSQRKRKAPTTTMMSTEAPKKPTTPSNNNNNNNHPINSASSRGPQSKSQLQPSNSNSSSTTLMPFECPVCLEEMAEPKLLHCGHNLCGVCESKLLKKQNDGGKGGGGGAAGTLTRYLACPLCAKVTSVGPEGLVVNYTVRELAQRAKMARQEEAKLAANMEACELCMRRSPRSEMFTCMAAECLEKIRFDSSIAVSDPMEKGGGGPSATNDDDNDVIYRGCRSLCAVCACKHHKGHTELIELAELASDADIGAVTHLMRERARKMPLPIALDGERNPELGFFLDPIREMFTDYYESVYLSNIPMLKNELRIKSDAFKSMAYMSEKFLVEQMTQIKEDAAAFKHKITAHLSAYEKSASAAAKMSRK